MCLERNKQIYDELNSLFPDAKCELNYKNSYELITAVILSAQTTDVRVNMVTRKLFEKYPTINDLSTANIDDVKQIILPVGLANTKAKNIIKMASEVKERFNGIVPSNIKDLMSLAGVGRKTASVVLVEGYNIPAVPVDTHVFRAAKRLGISDGKNVEDVEKDIWKGFEKDKLPHLHHLLIHFGRYICTAKKPKCDKCPLIDECKMV